MFGDVAKLAVELSLTGNFNQGIANAEGSLNRLNGSVGKLGSKIGNDLGQGIRNTARNLERLAVVAGGLAIGGGLAAVKWAADFDAQLRTINTIAQLSESDLQKLGDGVRDLARKTGAPLDDLTAGYYDLLSAGIKVTDAQQLLNKAYDLGRGALGSTAQGVDVLTTAINSYGSSSLYAGKSTSELATIFADQLAVAVRDGKVTLDQIAGTFSDVAPLAAQAGIGVDQIAAAYGVITAKGSNAASVTTQMSRAIIELIKPSADLEALQKTLGKNYREIASQKGLVVALQQIRDDATKSGIPFETLFGRLEGLRFVLSSTGVNLNDFGVELGKVQDSAGALDAQVGARNTGLTYTFGQLQANIKDAGITIGNALLPALIRLSAKLTKFLQDNSGNIAKFADQLAVGFEKAAKWAEQLDWKSIGDTIKSIGNFGASLAKGFLAMPTEAKELILGLYGLNKLSGGAVVNIGVDITKGLLGGLLGRGSQGNPMYVRQIGVGGATGGAGGFLGKVAVVGGLVLAASTIVELSQALAAQSAANKQAEVDLTKQTTGYTTSPYTTQTDLQKSLDGILAYQERLLRGDLAFTAEGLAYTFNIDHAYDSVQEQIKLLREAIAAGKTSIPRPQTGGKSPDERDEAKVTAAAAIAAHAIKSPIFGMSLEQIMAGIKQRSAARFGGTGLGKEAVDATFGRDLLRAGQQVADSSATLATKVGDLKTIQALLIQGGDSKTAAAIQRLIDKLDPTGSQKKPPQNVSLSPDDRDELKKQKVASDRTSADVREGNRIATLSKSAIDYAKVATTNHIDTTTEAIRTSQAAIVAAIAGMKLSVNIGAGTVTTAQVTAGNYNNPSTLNRGTPPPVRPGQAPVAS